MSGDYAGLTVDAVTGTFWAAHEYATGATTLTNWGTWIAEFALADPAGAWVTASSPSETVVAPSVQSLTFTFSEPMDTASFSLAEDVALFTGPGGADLRTQLLVWGSFRWSPDGRVLTVNFPAQSAFGSYALVLGPQIVRASDGQPLDQNGNGLPGEVPGDRYTAAFTLNSLGPDGFGYTARLHPFQAIGLVPGAPGVFTILDNVNDGVARLDLGGNTFNFYGTVSQSLFIGSNGLVTLGSGVSSGANQNGFIAPLQHAFAPLWDDWRTDLDADDQVLGKYEDTDGNGTADRLIIEWHQVHHAPASPLAVTFQAVLSLNTGANTSDIVFNYPNLDTGDANADGASATVGIKDQGAQGGNQVRVSFNDLSPFVGSGKAIHFSAPPIAGEIRGQVFNDRNRNGTHDPGEPGLADWTVYLDLDGNGRQDADEPFTQTDASGNYAITGVVPGGYTVRAERQRGWVRSPAAGSRILEDFESGRLGAYQAVGATFGSALVLADAAHGGGLGLCDNCLFRSGADWIVRNDAAVQVAQGDTISVWLQLANTADGRAHFGFGATPLGTLSLVVAADTNQLRLEQNLGYDAAGPVLTATIR